MAARSAARTGWCDGRMHTPKPIRIRRVIWLSAPSSTSGPGGPEEALRKGGTGDPRLGEAGRVGQHALLEGFLVEFVQVDIGAFEGSLRLVEQAESHRGVSGQCALQTVGGWGPRRSRRAY